LNGDADGSVYGDHGIVGRVNVAQDDPIVIPSRGRTSDVELGEAFDVLARSTTPIFNSARAMPMARTALRDASAGKACSTAERTAHRTAFARGWRCGSG